MASENKTKPTAVAVAEFIAAVPDAQRRADAQVLVRMLQDVTGEPPVMWGPTIVGFGKYRYEYDSGRTGEAPLSGFSPRKTELVLYILPGFDDYRAQLGRLGRHRTGKACLYVKRLADVDLDVLRELMVAGVAAMANARVRC